MNRSETEHSTPIADDSSHEEDSDSGQSIAASNPIEDDSDYGERITESEVIDEIAALNCGESLPDELASLKLQATSKKRVTLRQDILELNHHELKEHIRVESRNLYGDEAKDEQLKAVAALVHDRHTFVLAGTGFGKTRITEMYHNLFQPYQKSIVLVLNPLDSLGDNQVEEKRKVGVNNRHIKAVNLTSKVLNAKTARKIISGKFEFVYLSPEAFLNSEIFRDVYFNPKFQSRLSLIVVDEAHMVYVWGLVANGQSKGLTSHLKHGERGVFRPGYGELAARLMATNGTPLLMMSATCRPIAINSILESFKLTRQMVTFVEAELTRPEIRMLRINMQKSLVSSEDLADLYSTQEQTPDNEIIPTLIYSTTRNLTGQVLDVIHNAREANQKDDPFSTFARRYHSITGDMVSDSRDSETRSRVSSSMALSFDMSDARTCWRDGRKGVAIMFVEPHRQNGKNSVSDFTNVELQNDDDRMDAVVTGARLGQSFGRGKSSFPRRGKAGKNRPNAKGSEKLTAGNPGTGDHGRLRNGGSGYTAEGLRGAGSTEGRKRGLERTRGGSGGGRPAYKRPEEYLDQQALEG
ncbi:uncharacterized protein PGTG_16558 [Puccinia graminis f. sp. tritici CRL 75-36-700-3]|uniref:DNA 3'-5' helicase n=1 Tax=Puccinia graminis f. sp. tritici (strain CRL 75-36-700-3 / race SCCL) TaxID=418459 RepID=E3L1V7_PUCGT|nr:uncharacterized protein PGTG_16558 [Puccinia graminis f. sp. tritici CRL 75-36-700-3]EFP90532.2 hypothetical protein PGTG_16558 [Puccinia graminis f. sp. tritici CRL 75-36-700-3]